MTETLQRWLNSGHYLLINEISLTPQSRDGLPVVNQSEEATAYFFVDSANKGWVLKKFLPDQLRDRAYTDALHTLIPHVPGFESGFQRTVLKHSSVSRSAFCDEEFSWWLDGTILMPQILSPTWAELAESMRKETIALSTSERLSLCAALNEMVDRLELACLAHRDLSGRNVLIDPVNCEIHVIDWDGLYHPELKLQSNTTWGTEGYTAPFSKGAGPEFAYLSWKEKADRFALAVLNIELLTVGVESPTLETSELLLQSDIDNRAGPTIEAARTKLGRTFPFALTLFDRALKASSFLECPTPAEWLEFSQH